MKKHAVINAFVWAMVITACFVLILGATLVSIIVGDWVLIHTGELGLGWLVGLFVFTCFLVSFGIAMGVFSWMRTPYAERRPPSQPYVIETLIKAAREGEPRD